jgi:hypothetical protein
MSSIISSLVAPFLNALCICATQHFHTPWTQRLQELPESWFLQAGLRLIAHSKKVALESKKRVEEMNRRRKEIISLPHLFVYITIQIAVSVFIFLHFWFFVFLRLGFYAFSEIDSAIFSISSFSREAHRLRSTFPSFHVITFRLSLETYFPSIPLILISSPSFVTSVSED